jgi:hypothetical protein
MPNPNRQMPASWCSTSRPGSNHTALGIGDQLCRLLGLQPETLQLPPLLWPFIPARSHPVQTGEELPHGQGTTGGITERQHQRRILPLLPEHPRQRLQHPTSQDPVDSQRWQIRHPEHVAEGTGSGRRGIVTPVRGDRRPHLGLGQPSRNRSIRPASHRCRTVTAPHPHHRTPDAHQPRHGPALVHRIRQPVQIINLNRRHHHPRRNRGYVNPRHGIEYARRPRQPGSQATELTGPRAEPPAAGALPRTPAPLRRAGKGHQVGCLLTARTSPARRRAAPRKGNTAPCTPDPPPGSPTGAPRGDNQPKTHRRCVNSTPTPQDTADRECREETGGRTGDPSRQ